MDQGLSADETASEHELTFFIETQLADSHPGVIRVRELRKGAKRLLKRSHVFLDRLDREKETAGEAIAHLIYEDQTEHRQGKYKGPRWNFLYATQLHLIQVIERPDPSLGQNARPLKKEVGTALIPGELDAPAIIACIAKVIDDGWQPPPDEAYLASEEPNTGSARSAGPPFPLTVQCLYNYRTLTGPVVFIATEEDGVSIDQCAILLGEHDPSPSSQWYHLFTFEDTGEALFLCDQGVRALTVVLTQKNVEGKLEGVDPTQEGKDHAKDPTNIYERVQDGSGATGPNEQETLSANCTRFGYRRQYAASLAQAVLRARRAGVSRQWASDSTRRGNSPAEARK